MDQRLTSCGQTTDTDPILDDLVAEISQKLHAGQPVDFQEYAREHPELAEALRRMLPALQSLAELGPRSGSEELSRPTFAPAPGPGRGVLGDYRIMREVGCGGMGVVYEAEQVSLARRVALKVLPFAAVLDPRRLQRFNNEAHAAASLKHPNIVRIYSVGCERGVHYYAMEYVEGRTLAQVIAELRGLSAATPAHQPQPVVSQITADLLAGGKGAEEGQPAGEPAPADSVVSAVPHVSRSAETTRQPEAGVSTKHSIGSREFFRSAANLGIQAAEALEHAHQLGVVHRDIKPSNLMVDAQGHLWITDFGLAQIAASSPLVGEGRGEAANLTMTGDILGTLRYMSPEQASGRSRMLDHHTDIYSLAVTLYELLTLRPPFAGDDRQQVLRQITDDEPAPPRQLNRAVPKDLETVLLKAMAKEPQGRYATAQTLADDLKRFLADEPIRARRPSVLERASRWSRRHRPIVWAAAATLMIAAAALAASTLLISGAYQREKTGREFAQEQRRIARQQEALAREQKGLAEEQKELADQQKAEAERQRAEAFRQRDAAKANLYLAQMRLAQQDYHAGQTARLHEMLDSYVPDAGQPDLRGWEWYHLLSLCHGELLTLRGHAAGVLAVAWSPDGRRLASASEDKTIRLWDAGTGDTMRILTGHEREIRSMNWSPDGRYLASASNDNTVKLWDPTSGQEVRTLAGHAKAVLSVAWSPDSHRLATTSLDRTVKIWDAASGETLFSYAGHADPAQSVAWSPDSKCVASGAGSRYPEATINVWDAAGGREVWTLRGHDGGPTSLAWSPDGLRLASACHDQTVKIWDMGNGRELRTLPIYSGWVRSVAWSPDGRQLALSTEGSTVQLWDAATGAKVRAFHGHTQAVYSVAWSPDGNRLASASGDRTIRVWEAQRDPEVRTLRGHAGIVRSVAWSPDGRQLASAASDKRVVLWDAATGRQARVLDGHGAELRAVAWGAHGRVAAADLGGAVTVWDADAGKDLFTLEGPPGNQVSLCLSPDGRFLAAAGSQDKTIRIWDAATGKEMTRLDSQAGVVEIVKWRPDGQRLASAGYGSPVVWDTASWQRVPSLRFDASGWKGLAWSPDGQRLASSDLRAVVIWDATSGKTAFRLVGHTGHILSLAWHPDGRRLASSAEEGTIKVWDTATGQEIFTLQAAGKTREVAWSPDGCRLASASGETVQIWDASVAYRIAAGPKYRYDQAHRLAAQGRNDEALAILQKLPRELAGHPQDALDLARSFAEQGRLEESLAALRKLPEPSPEKAEDRLELARQLAAKGSQEDAIAVLHKLASDFPDKADYRWELAQCLVKTDQQDEAIAVLQKLADDFPDAAEYRKELAKACFRRGDRPFHQNDFEKAFPDLDLAIRYDPDYSEAYDHRGTVYRRRGEWDKAIADYDASIRCGAAYAVSTYVGRGLAYVERGEFDSGFADLNKALELRPGWSSAYSGRGFAYLKKGDFDKAIADCDEAIRLDPDHAAAYANRAEAYWETAQVDRAIADLSLAVALAPDDANAHYRLALARLVAGRLYKYRVVCAGMLDRFGQAASVEAGHWTAWACALGPEAAGDFTPAVALAEKAVTSDPNTPFYLQTLGAVLYRAGRFEEAVERLMEADRLAGTAAAPTQFSPAYTWFFLAMAHHRLGHREEAKQWADKPAASIKTALRDDQAGKPPRLPWNRRATWKLLGDEAEALLKTDPEQLHDTPLEQRPHVHYLRGQVHLEKGDLEQAVAEYSEAIRLDPNAVFYLARGEAYAAKGEPDRAVGDLSEAIRLDPTDAQAWIARGSIRSDRGEMDKAEADFRQAIRADAGCAQQRFLCAEAWRAKKQPKRALADYRNALRLDPRFTGAYLSYSGLAKPATGNLEAVLADLRLAARVRTDVDAAWLPWLAAWLAAAARGPEMPPGAVYVSDMPWVRSSCGWNAILGWGPSEAVRDNSPDGPLSIARFPYPKGVWTNSFHEPTPADVVVDVSGRQFTTFKAHVGVAKPPGTIQFQVLADGAVKQETPILRFGTLETISADVAGAREVILRVLNGGDDGGWDSAVWGFARFVQAGAEDPLEDPPAELHSAIDANAAFFLAEVHWRLDQKDRARRWYDKAAAWIDRNKTEAEKLGLFRARAAQLLGIADEAAVNMATPQQPKEKSADKP